MEVKTTIKLYNRHHGVHTFIGKYTYKLPEKLVVRYTCNARGYEYVVDDFDLALKVKRYLGVDPSDCLLTIGDDNGSAGVSYCDHFQPWSKYFDCNVIELYKPDIVKLKKNIKNYR